RVGVVADLVAGLEDRRDRLRIAVGGPAGYEERRRERVLAQQVEDPRDADERAVRLVRHDAEVARVEAALGEDRRLGVHVEGEAGDHARISARRESSSYITVAPASAVTEPGPSYGGETSTTSQPSSRIPRRLRTNASASAVEKPPTSGVPVPGANAGSRKSMSNDMNTGRSPTFERTRSPYRAAPRSRSSSDDSTVKPSSRATSMSSAPYSEPRIPACTD